MTEKIADLQHTLGEVAKASPRKLRCAICRRSFFAAESNGVAYWIGATKLKRPFYTWSIAVRIA